MAVVVYLQTEDGKRLEEVMDSSNFLYRLESRVQHLQYKCISFIDLYGDTMFNKLQAGVLLEELREVGHLAEGDEDAGFLKGVEELARRCRDSIHEYVLFVGD